MKALITNDDGVESPGLATLAEAARRCGLEVLVAAPSWNSSGASSSLTGVQDDGRLRSRRINLPHADIAAHAVEAAPALIAVLAMRGAFGEPPDVVLSGVNCGRNTGHAVLHSGTVGAALTARNLGARGLAVSIDADVPGHWETAGAVAERAITWLCATEHAVVLNVNVPDVPADDLRGLRLAPLASVGAVQTSVTDVGEGYVQLEYEPPRPAEPGTDAALLAEGWAVATPLRTLTEDDSVDVSALAFGPRTAAAR